MKSSNYCSVLFLFVALFIIERTSTKPIRWATENIQEFIGTFSKPDGRIKIIPEIRIKLDKGESVCSFILTDGIDGVLPFLVNVKSADEGIGEMTVIGPIDKDFYRMTIKAKLCSSELYSREVNIIMKVNQKAPKWEQNVYDVTINDDLNPGARVLKVRAYEDLKNQQNEITTICNYRIDAPLDAPFDIDGNGVIRTTDYLDSTKHRNYVLRIAAIDCQYPHPQRSEVSVNIRVRHVCKYGWNGLYDQINYQPLSGNHFIGERSMNNEPGIRFDRCSPTNKSDDSDWLPVCDASMKANQTAVKVQLNTIKDTKCDLDRESVEAMRKSCGVNQRTIDLLPKQYEFQQEAQKMNSPNIRFTDNNKGIYNFDGATNYWEIPTDVLAPNHYLGQNYTVMFWMNHGDKRVRKEQILCNSDGEAKNRHHYSIYLHNCKLIILSRTESYGNQGNNYTNIPLLTPAEWRFKSPEFCDGKWHHYVVAMTSVSKRQFPQKPAESIQRAELFIDGHKFIPTAANFEIVDDVPMQYIPSVHFTKLSIGACWLSKVKRFNQFFKGQLASVSILQGQKESPAVLECINQCQEHLVFSGFRTMSSHTSISINSELSMMLVKATNINNVAKIIQNIGYKNQKYNPLPGPRTITISTSLICSNGVEKTILTTHNLTVMVLARSDQSKSIFRGKSPIKLSGKSYIEITSQDELRSNQKGIPLLESLVIKDQSVKPGSKIKKASLLQSCVFYPMRSLRSFPQERLAFSDNIIVALANQGIKLEVTNDSHGLVIEGKQKISIYQNVLRKVAYYNDWLTKNFSRTFKVTCTQGDSMMQISNTLEIKVTLSNLLRKSLPSPSKLPSTLNQINPTYHLDLDHISSNQNVASSHSQSGLVDGLDESLSAVDESSTVVKMNYSNTVIIVSVVALIIVAILLMGFVRSYNHSSLLNSSPSHVTRFSTVFSGISSSLSRAANRNHGRSSSSNHKRANPWVRLRPEPMVTEGFGVKMRRDVIGEDDGRSEDFQITVNPLLDYEKNVSLFKRFMGAASKNNNQSKSDKLHRVNLIGHSDNQSLDELPDEYDGESEDYHDENDDKLIIENDERDELILDDVDIDDEDDDDDEYDDSSNDSYNRYGRNSQHQFYQTGSSLSYQLKSTSKNTTNQHNSSVNIHSNPRYSFDNFGHIGNSQ